MRGGGNICWKIHKKSGLCPRARQSRSERLPNQEICGLLVFGSPNQRMACTIGTLFFFESVLVRVTRLKFPIFVQSRKRDLTCDLDQPLACSIRTHIQPFFPFLYVSISQVLRDCQILATIWFCHLIYLCSLYRYRYAYISEYIYICISLLTFAIQLPLLSLVLFV